MKCYAVIDTNVLVSALLSANEDSATVQVVARMLGGEITPVYSNEIMAEYREVLKRKKFGFSPDAVEYLLAALQEFGIASDPAASDAVLPDEKDLPFYEVSLGMRDDGAYLVTGNIRHFPQKPFIVTPRQMLDILDGNNPL